MRKFNVVILSIVLFVFTTFYFINYEEREKKSFEQSKVVPLLEQKESVIEDETQEAIESKILCIKERFSDVCYLRNVGIDQNGQVVLFDLEATDEDLKPKNIGNTITARHDLRNDPNVLVRSIRESMNRSKCHSIHYKPTVYFAAVTESHYWHAIHDCVMPFFATLVENYNLLENNLGLIEPEELLYDFTTKEIRDNQLILHTKSSFKSKYRYLIDVFTNNEASYISDIISPLKDSPSPYVCFENIAVGVSDKANLYYRDEFVKHDRRPLVFKFIEMVTKYHNLSNIKPIEWEDKSLPITVNIISRKKARSLTNEKDILNKCEELSSEINIKCRLVSLEKLSKIDQIKLALTTSILVGVHGNGLSNILWMNKGAAVIQIWPFGAKGNTTWQGTPLFKGENFINAAQIITGNYFEWEAPVERCSLRNQKNRTEVQDPNKFWRTNFYKAQNLFLSQTVEMDLDVWKDLLLSAYNVFKTRE